MTTRRADGSRPVLILGAGINGCAVARELALNNVPVWLVDSGDIGRGATSRSSRLIHGGLRYLEYRDLALVQESLAERERLLQLAPQFVTPLRLAIPVSGWFGGLLTAALRFTRLTRRDFAIGRNRRRGLLAVRIGLFLYDWMSRRVSTEAHDPAFIRKNHGTAPKISRRTFPWVCEYSDAQMIFPERFVLALLADAEKSARTNRQPLEIRTWSEVSRNGSQFQIRGPAGTEKVEPSVVINATGAWGDFTLKSLGSSQPTLFAGTKGSHLYSTHAGLRSALANRGVYAEAADGRLVFILPCAEGTLIGTTDLLFEGLPDEAIAEQFEVDYLLDMVHSVFESVRLTANDVEMRHAGVRPLPRVESASAAAIPRGHSIHSSRLDEVEVLTLIGGKLTTCRALAEEVADRVLTALTLPRRVETQSRLIPGAENWPVSPRELTECQSELARRYRLSHGQVAAVWSLVGNRFEEIFSETQSQTDRSGIVGTDIPRQFVRWTVQNEYCQRIEDLVERRLMLTFSKSITRETLRQLAEELAAAGRLDPDHIELAIDEAAIRLRHYYGKMLTEG